jgi:GNAT superfamily N-acetyltransferase
MGEAVEIKSVRTSAEKKSFIKFPRYIYKRDPNWVQPLIGERGKFFNSKKNPFFEHGEVELFLATRNKKHVGRIAAIVDHNYNEFQDEKAGFFGCFETIDDREVAEVLLEKAVNWVKSKGMEIIYGPASFTANDEYGLLIEGFDLPPVVMMSYNPPYYPKLIEQYGFQKARDLMAYFMTDDKPIPERIVKISKRIQQRKEIQLRTIDMKQLEGEVKIIMALYNKVLENIWGFVPLTDAEINYLVAHLKKIVEPGLVIFAEIDHKPVGFIISLPDINQALIKLNGRLLPVGIFKLLWYSRQINRIRVISMGVLPEYRKWGIETLLYIKTIQKGMQLGYKGAELSFVLEDNSMMNRAARSLGAALYKRYRIYKKTIVSNTGEQK